MNTHPLPFRLGVNYWPARTAMRWWSAFDPHEVSTDFARIASSGMDSVRIFLSWEAFQPSLGLVDPTAVQRLITILNVADQVGLRVMLTLFTGHMSGVNWVPHWALGNTAGDDRFRVVSTGRVVEKRLASWYSEPRVTDAQVKLAAELAAAVAGHAALWAWDLGNENSNCAIPQTRDAGRSWLHRVTSAIRQADATVQVTVGLHMEDLEHDRNLGPAEAAEVCDFLTMHGYPGYAKWTDGPTDERLLPFLARVTRWLGGGTDVLFSEFGVPSLPADAIAASPNGPELVSEAAAAAYVERALHGLQQSGCSGAMLWCFSDYDKVIWHEPPLDQAVHERTFGLWRSDASPKPTVAVTSAFAGRHLPITSEPTVADETWLDLSVDEFLRAPEQELPRLYRRYCAACARP